MRKPSRSRSRNKLLFFVFCGNINQVDALNLAIRGAERESRDSGAESSDANRNSPNRFRDRNPLREAPQHTTEEARARRPRDVSSRPPPPPSRRKETSAAVRASSAFVCRKPPTAGVKAGCPRRKKNIDSRAFDDEEGGELSSSRDDAGNGSRRRSESSCSSESLTLQHRAHDGVLDVAGDSKQQQQRRQWRRWGRRRRQRDDDTAGPHPDSQFFETEVSTFGAAPPAPRFLGEPRSRARTAPDSRSGDEGGGTADDSVNSSTSGGGGGRGNRGKCRAQERSEELARASAATWEQFQELLERSRESKARFDRAMDGAAGAEPGTAAAAAEEPKGIPASCFSVADGGHGISSCGEVVGKDRQTTVSLTSSPEAVGSRASVLEAPVIVSKAARVGATASMGGGVSSTDRVLLATVTSSVGDGSDRSAGGASIATGEKVGVAHTSFGKCDFDATEVSRLTAATDVDTSSLLDDREVAAAAAEQQGEEQEEEDRPSTTEDSSGGDICDQTGEKLGRRRRRLASKLAPPRHRLTAAATATTVMDLKNSAARVQKLEAQAEALCQEATVAAQTESRLRQELTSSASAAESELQRLRDELATLKETVVVERQREREAASARVLAEREQERQRNTEAAVAAEATRDREETRVEEALAAAAKAERARAEAVRQREELEKALCAVRASI